MSAFEPEPVPEEIEAIPEYLMRMLRNIANIQRGITYIDSLAFQVQHSEPHDLFTGLILYADGTDWNPGSGEGLYERTSAPAWVKL